MVKMNVVVAVFFSCWVKNKSSIKVPEFIMIRNAYNSSIKPFSVQINNIVLCAVRCTQAYHNEYSTVSIKTTDDRTKRSISPKSPRRSGIRKIRA